MLDQGLAAIILASPLVLFPAAFIWYINLGGGYRAVRRAFYQKKGQTEVSGKD